MELAYRFLIPIIMVGLVLEEKNYLFVVQMSLILETSAWVSWCVLGLALHTLSL